VQNKKLLFYIEMVAVTGHHFFYLNYFHFKPAGIYTVIATLNTSL